MPKEGAERIVACSADERGRTALAAACLGGHSEAVETLLAFDPALGTFARPQSAPASDAGDALRSESPSARTADDAERRQAIVHALAAERCESAQPATAR